MKTTKQCTKCEEIKDFSEFTKNKSKKNGIESCCKLCSKMRVKEYYKENKNKVLQYQESYRNINKEKIAKRDKEYSIKNKEVISKQRKEYRVKNKDMINAKAKIHRALNPDQMIKYRKENKEKIKITTQKWRKNNVEKLREYSKEYAEKNTAKIKLYQSSVRARVLASNRSSKRRELKHYSSNGTLPINVMSPLNGELLELLNNQENMCYLCKSDISKNRHLDHWIPLSKGGTHSIDNVVFLCANCNLSKGATIPTSLLLI